MLASIGANVRRIRVKEQLTQGDLAEAADLSVRYVQRVERGKMNLSVQVLVALARALKVPPARLFRDAKMIPARPGRPRSRPARD